MNAKQLQMVHEVLVEGDWIEGANLAFAAEHSDTRVQDRKEAFTALKALEQNLANQEKFMDLAVLLWGNMRFDSRPRYVKQVFDAVIKNHKLIILGGSSTSKCLGPDVRVRMFDGTTKAAKNVSRGDVLMGDDSRARNVLETHSGTGKLFKITPDRGDPWICNEDHILSLRQGTRRHSRGIPSRKWVKDEVYDIGLKEYMGFSKFRKGCLKQFSVGVDYETHPTRFDPYIYGLWLGDGCYTSGVLAAARGAPARRWKKYFESIGMFCKEYPHSSAKCSAWVVSGYRIRTKQKRRPNQWRVFVHTSKDKYGKFILPEYLINDRDVRIKVLAGLIDTDGCVIDKGTAFLIGATPRRLTRQIFWLARSLGFGAHIYRRRPSRYTKRWSHAITITGKGIENIPTLKKRLSRKSKRTTTNVGIKKITCIGRGKYYGFLIDGNHRFLLEDFTVTHNTYSCGVLFLLYWRSDPYWTAIKLAGPSEDHLYGNLFSHIVGLHKTAAIPMTENDAKMIDINETDLFISMHDAIPEFRIQCVLCKQNQVSATGLRGHKPKPSRPYLHPKLGRMTRIYILIDEGTQVSPGAFEDIKTTEASINPDSDSVKIVMACNPEGVDYRIVELAEPEDGWDADQADTLYNWTSKKGYAVLRLDGKLCENVVERKMIYEGLLSYPAYIDFLKSGEFSGPYWAKGRGFPPLKDNAHTVVPPAWMQSQRGEPIYVGDVKNIWALDTALQGADKALFGVGRWGEASGWRNLKGEEISFVDRANPGLARTKHVAVLDQIFQLPKSNMSTEIIQEVMGRCKQMGMGPEDGCMDKGGNASGCWSHAKTFWGDVLGVEFGVKASETKILAEDLMSAYDTYDGKATEMWYAMKRWLDPSVCALLINPIVPTNPLFTHVTTRRYWPTKGGRVRVEAKEVYKARNQGVSPDEADILLLLVEFCRERGGVTPGMHEKRADSGRGDEQVSLKNADVADTLGTEWVSNRLED